MTKESELKAAAREELMSVPTSVKHTFAYIDHLIADREEKEQRIATQDDLLRAAEAGHATLLGRIKELELEVRFQRGMAESALGSWNLKLDSSGAWRRVP